MIMKSEFRGQPDGGGATTEIRHKFDEWSHKLEDMKHYRRDFEQKVTERPLLSVAIALFAGYFLGMMLGR